MYVCELNFTTKSEPHHWWGTRIDKTCVGLNNGRRKGATEGEEDDEEEDAPYY